MAEIKTGIGQRREGADKRDNLLYQDVVPGNRRSYSERERKRERTDIFCRSEVTLVQFLDTGSGGETVDGANKRKTR